MAASDAIKGMASKIKKMSKKPNGTKKTENGVTYWQDDNYHWEQGNLKDTEKTLKQGAKWNKEKSKTGWTNPRTGDKFSADHYKENYKNDIQALNRIKKEINNRKLIKNIKDKEKKIANDIKYKKRDKIDDYLED